MGGDLVCPYGNCGKEFRQPVVLTNETETEHKKYYACPHCLSKVDLVLQDAKNFSTVKAVASIDPKIYSYKQQKPENCTFYIEYLKALLDNTPLPEACLICSKVMVCIAKAGKV